MGRHAPPPPSWQRWLVAHRGPAAAIAAVAVVALAGWLLAPSVTGPAGDPLPGPVTAQPSASASRTPGTPAPSYPTAVVPSVGASGAWDPDRDPAGSGCGRCGTRRVPPSASAVPPPVAPPATATSTSPAPAPPATPTSAPASSTSAPASSTVAASTTSTSASEPPPVCPLTPEELEDLDLEDVPDACLPVLEEVGP